ncbi:TPA: DUF4224 domain-containing protein [Burkholderia vietnamiensis]|nr:DUF4224 domain-containing protein [Burkholderia vietnamiensis]
MSLYVSRDQLAELVGCRPRSLACMKRWLERHHWPHAVNIAGVPLVSREYYEARMNGTSPAESLHKVVAEEEPNFDALTL